MLGPAGPQALRAAANWPVQSGCPPAAGRRRARPLTRPPSPPPAAQLQRQAARPGRGRAAQGGGHLAPLLLPRLRGRLGCAARRGAARAWACWGGAPGRAGVPRPLRARPPPSAAAPLCIPVPCRAPAAPALGPTLTPAASSPPPHPRPLPPTARRAALVAHQRGLPQGPGGAGGRADARLQLQAGRREAGGPPLWRGRLPRLQVRRAAAAVPGRLALGARGAPEAGAWRLRAARVLAGGSGVMRTWRLLIAAVAAPAAPARRLQHLFPPSPQGGHPAQPAARLVSPRGHPPGGGILCQAAGGQGRPEGQPRPEGAAGGEGQARRGGQPAAGQAAPDAGAAKPRRVRTARPAPTSARCWRRARCCELPPRASQAAEPRRNGPCAPPPPRRRYGYKAPRLLGHHQGSVHYLSPNRSANALVAHLKDGIEVVHLFTGELRQPAAAPAAAAAAEAAAAAAGPAAAQCGALDPEAAAAGAAAAARRCWPLPAPLRAASPHHHPASHPARPPARTRPPQAAPSASCTCQRTRCTPTSTATAWSTTCLCLRARWRRTTWAATSTTAT